MYVVTRVTKKITRNIITFVLALLIGIGATIGVLAASNQSVRTNMNVTYHADNVHATVSATYQVAGQSSATNLLNSSGGTSITFTASERTQDKDLHSPENIVLDFDSGYVLFTYMFTNNATRTASDQGYDIKISLIDNSTYSHMSVKYMTTSQALSGTLSGKYKAMSASASSTVPNYVYVGAGNTAYYHILVQVDNFDYDASFTSTASAGLIWHLEHADEKDFSYTPVEYLQTSGEPYIDTGITGDQTIKAEVTFASTADPCCVFGAQQKDGNNANYGITMNFATTQNNSRFGYYNVSGYSASLDGTKHTIAYGQDGFYDNGEKLYTPSAQSAFTTDSLSVFKAIGAASYGEKKIFGCKIWKNSILVRNFIPVVRQPDMTAGLYDQVEGKFYSNMGTGSFIAGSAVLPSEYQQVDYIQSSGTQYINTGVTPTTLTGINITYSYNSISADSNAGVCGVFQPSNPRTDTLFITTNSGKTDTNLFLAHSGATLQIAISPIANTFYNTKINWLNDGKMSIDGNEAGSIGSNNIESREVIIFGRYYNGNSAFSSCRISACQFSEGTTLIRDFVPCYRKSDNKAGLYDRVTGKFYGNMGTGSFIAGPNSN